MYIRMSDFAGVSTCETRNRIRFDCYAISCDCDALRLRCDAKLCVPVKIGEFPVAVFSVGFAVP